MNINPLYLKGLKSKQGGVYKLINLVNFKLYIGSALIFRERWYDHVSLLRKGLHYNVYMQRSWNKYGEKNFKFEIVELIENPRKETLEQREQYWMDYYQSYERDKGYNICTQAYTKAGVSSKFKGIKRTYEEKQKMRRTTLIRMGHSSEEIEKLLLELSQSEKRKNAPSASASKLKYWDDIRKGIRIAPKRRIIYQDTLHNYAWCLDRSNENLSITEIMELCGSDRSSVLNAFKRFNLPYRVVDSTFKRGFIPANKGKKLSDIYSPEEAKELSNKMSKAQKDHRAKLPINPICVNGHNKDIVGRTKGGKCKVCTGERTRAYYAIHREEILEQKRDKASR